MPRVQWVRISVITLFMLAGCTVSRTPPSSPTTELPTTSTIIPKRVDTDEVVPWISEERAFIVVDKSCGTVNLYQYGRLSKTYPAVFGRKSGKKIHEGDQRTPSGLYMIITKDNHNRWNRFMRLDYPNARDRQQYWQNVADGKIPKQGAGHTGLGGAIGIHGTDNEAFNRAKINWTLGCVSLFNKDVKELASLVSVGTLVYIKD
jgi:murein L,D-transpeptidase YafK